MLQTPGLSGVLAMKVVAAWQRQDRVRCLCPLSARQIELESVGAGQAAPLPALPSPFENTAISVRLIAACRVGEVICAPSRSVT